MPDTQSPASRASTFEERARSRLKYVAMRASPAARSPSDEMYP